MKKLVIALGTLATLFTGYVLSFHIRYDYSLPNSFFRALLAPFVNTVWAKNYSEQNFEAIRMGMLESELLTLMGEPLRVDCPRTESGEEPDHCQWVYSWQPDGRTSFDWRTVHVARVSGEVTGAYRRFFVD